MYVLRSAIAFQRLQIIGSHPGEEVKILKQFPVGPCVILSLFAVRIFVNP